MYAVFLDRFNGKSNQTKLIAVTELKNLADAAASELNGMLTDHEKSYEEKEFYVQKIPVLKTAEDLCKVSELVK